MTGQEVPAWFRHAGEGIVGSCESGQLLVTVSIEKLVDLLDPLHADPWSVGLVTRDQVTAALRDGRLRTENPCWQDSPGAMVDSDAHAERIAWLVRYGWDTAAEFLQVEVDEYGGIGLEDGHHRLYVLAFLGLDGPIMIELTGYLDMAEILLDVTIPRLPADYASSSSVLAQAD
ncbi:hypothetical protein [Amycolatopsis sp. PS_44_ISF1]|uniref:hypothetical protein n=1 Tax=Amycolatopsis sp. PS_44_ISF1 TaxID=2974917 RepID=UPI0028DFFD7D|nr:hypothetical protein [Amycolatopsis sp. PS_44_ISF1]MDT8913527.1 hypothetical protein [Amycolatopsis sp. PS_44_ISF1]